MNSYFNSYAVFFNDKYYINEFIKNNNINMNKIFISVKNFLTALKLRIKRVFSEKVDKFVLEYGPAAVSVVNWIKAFDSSVKGDLLTIIIKQFTDNYGDALVDKIREILKTKIDVIIESLNLTIDMAKADTLDKKVLALLKVISEIGSAARSETLTKLSAMLANALADDNKISIDEAVEIVEYVYRNRLNK